MLYNMQWQVAVQISLFSLQYLARWSANGHRRSEASTVEAVAQSEEGGPPGPGRGGESGES